MSWNRRFISAERIFKNGFVNFGRNVWLAIAAIAMMTITLTILLFAVIANTTFRHSVSNLTDKIDVTVYLKDDTTEAARDQLQNGLKKAPNVKSIAYKSKAQALKDYEAASANNTDLLAAISETDNPLPASINIKPIDANQLQQIKDYIDNSAPQRNQIFYTSYSGDRKAAIDNITRATHFFQQAGIVGIIVFVVISMLIIFNTIRMAIFNRRDELIIMRLLGASTAFIRGPFVVETMLYGLVAAVVSVAACGVLFKVASSTLKASSLGLLDIDYSDKYFNSRLLTILTLQIAIGILIGAVSSAVATRRYLRLHQ
jgi:cell division transport system permease protein